MADDLLNMAMRQLGPAGIGALDRALGLPEGKGESALNAGLATTITGMLHTANERSGLGKLLSMVTGSGRLDLPSIASVVGDPEQLSSLQQSGASLLDGIFGSRKDGVVHTLSSALGLSDSVGGGAMKVIAPILMSVLGKIAQSKKMDMGDLATLLLEQKPFIADKLPGGMLQELGVTHFDHLGEGARAFSRGHAEPQAARTPKQRKVGAYGKWLWPLLVVLAALYALNMCTQRERAETPEVIEDEASEEAATRERPGPDTAASDFDSKFREYLAGTARDPNREFPLEVHFDSDSVTPGRASFPDVQALASVLQENPGLTVLIEGHTSSEGEEVHNQQLSERRAQAVREMLVNLGVDGNRVTATGVGSAKPVADNESEEGREKNRRITVRALTF